MNVESTEQSVIVPDGVHTIDVVAGDLAGILRGKRIPSGRWSHVSGEGLALASALTVWSPRCDILDETPRYNMSIGFPDLAARPIASTLRAMPWEPGVAQVLCQLYESDGSRCPFDARAALERVVEKASAMGFVAQVGYEFEFYLVDPETHLPRETDVQCYSPIRSARYDGVIGDIRNQLIEFGIAIEASNAEFAPGQFEVNTRYADAMTSADDAVRFRCAVKQIAAKHGYLATFMAKPWTEHAGSSLHMHHSLLSEGKNAFAGGAALSETGRHFLGGAQKHMAEMAIFGSPTPNSMKRRVPYSFCPTTNAWGGDNRTVGLRAVEQVPDSAVRIEQRDGASDANPYLTIAAQLAAGLVGIEQGIEPDERCLGDAYACHIHGHETLPATVPEAIQRAAVSTLAAEVFGAEYLQMILAMAAFEHEQTAGPVSELERERYLEIF